MKAKNLLIFFLVVFSNEKTNGQDTIFRADETIIVSKIIQITEGKVAYKLFNYQEGPTFIVRKRELNKIVYANGMADDFVMSNNINRKNPKDNINALRFDLPALAFGQTTLCLERGFRKLRQSLEIDIGVINNNPVYHSNFSHKGAFIKLGYKFFSRVELRHIRWLNNGNPLCGFYFKQEIVAGSFSSYYSVYNPNSNYPMI